MAEVGAVFGGRYRLDREVGRGLFARVFLATDLLVGRRIVVKVLHPELLHSMPAVGGDNILAGFRAEASLIAALDHPNLVPLHDYGEVEGTAYIVTPYFAGGTVHDRLRRTGPLSLAQAASYLRQAAAGLDYAHQRGIVHRDIKPQSLRLGDDGEHLFLDNFGIVTLLDSASALGDTGAVGTPAYLAPEMLSGSAGPAADIYALGCTLFAMLTGEPPYGGATAQDVLLAHREQPVPSLAERGQGRVPLAVQTVLDRALAKHPADRFARAGDLARAFQAAIDTNPALDRRFRFERELGRGGFSVVYLATDLLLSTPLLQRRVAVKVLHPALLAQGDDRNFLARFKEEASLVAALDHPNILGLHDYGEAQGTAYLVMPVVGGGSVHNLLRRAGPLDLSQAVGYVRQAAAALDYAHQRGIIHRDIKPQNLLLREGGEHLLLADFGIASLLSEAGAQSYGALLGTPAYMAPEQLRGEASPASDIYALGVVLFQMLTGQPPYVGHPEQVTESHRQAPVPSVAERSQGRVPATLQRVLDRALAKRPEGRYPSAGALAEALALASVTVPLRGLVHLEGLGDMPLLHDEFAGTRQQGRRLAGFQVQFDPPVPGLRLRYMAAVQGRGDLPWVEEGEYAGTRGLGLALEGFAIALAGPVAAAYTVYYMAHLQGTGDTGYHRDGEFCGTRGQSRCVEGLLVHVRRR